MADIDIECNNCGTTVTVSEFADASSISCRKCGEKLSRVEVAASPKPRATVKIRKREEEAAAESEEPVKEWRFHTTTKKDDSDNARVVFTASFIGAWALFLLLGGLLGWLRYGDFLTGPQLAMLRAYSPYLFLVVHFVVILSSFKYSVYQGVLGIMVPPYPYYFLFAVSDSFFMRAFVGAILIGVGQDAFVFLSAEGVVLYNAVTGWIASGG